MFKPMKHAPRNRLIVSVVLPSSVRHAACVGDFAVTNGPNLVGGQRRNRDCFPIERDEFDLQTGAATMKHDNSTDVATLERQIRCQEPMALT